VLRVLDASPQVEEGQLQRPTVADDPHAAGPFDYVEQVAARRLGQVDGLVETPDPLQGQELWAERLLVALGDPDRGCGQGEGRGDCCLDCASL
jgi:hypothetical protein